MLKKYPFILSIDILPQTLVFVKQKMKKNENNSLEISELMITSTETMTTLAENLAKYMAERGLNQVELAKKSGIKQQLISSYLNESSYAKFPSLNNLIALARALKCSLEELTGFGDIGKFEKLNIDSAIKLSDSAIKLAKFYESLPADDVRRQIMEDFLIRGKRPKSKK